MWVEYRLHGMNQESTRDGGPVGRGSMHSTVHSCLGWSMGGFSRQRRPDGGGTHCGWVSPRLQLYLLDWREQR